jgi:uncharacterized protein (TIGR00255 family)
MTLSSMTGFARADGGSAGWTWVAEARSVNGRSLELRFRGPQGFEGLERICREAAQRRFQRGQVGVNLQARRLDAAQGLVIDEDLISRYLAIGRRLSAEGHVGPPTADGLLGLPGVVRVAGQEDAAGDRGDIEAAMAATLEVAVEALAAARAAEGLAIQALVADQLDRIEGLVALARGEAQTQPALIKARFERRLIELAGEAAGQDRIAQEAAAFAVKADVQEELDRLAAHIAAARALLAQGGAAGRRLDFLTQEFMREANTLTAKSASRTLTAAGLELKVVIDQMREQAANVE